MTRGIGELIGERVICQVDEHADLTSAGICNNDIETTISVDIGESGGSRLRVGSDASGESLREGVLAIVG